VTEGQRARLLADMLERQSQLDRDPHRPQYHLLPPANWANDPNGTIQHGGEYHVFYQHNPFEPWWGAMHWGHVVSRDLVHWEHLPIALVPGPEAYDKDGIWSGCAVVHEGAPSILYTGVQPEVQCLATSDDNMRTWRKHPWNPIIGQRPPRLSLTGFRDPFAWREGEEWYLVIGSGICDVGGAALLYRSSDLRAWEYLHPLHVSSVAETGKMWECPNFFSVGGKHLLAVSTLGKVVCFLGEYSELRFMPERQSDMDLGNCFYASNCLLDDKGRRIMWGWAPEKYDVEAKKASGWAGVLTLPREVFLHPDDTLGIRPVPELRVLRGRHWHFANLCLSGYSVEVLPDVAGDQLEIAAELQADGDAQCGLSVRRTLPMASRSARAGEETLIVWNVAENTLCVDANRSSLDPKAAKFVVGGSIGAHGAGLLQLRVFLDRSIVEVFANERAVLTTRVYPACRNSLSVALLARGGRLRVRALDVWEMKSIRGEQCL